MRPEEIGGLEKMACGGRNKGWAPESPSQTSQKHTMQRVEDYKGHTIVVDTHAQGRGYQWSYAIDGGHFTEGRERPLKSAELMLFEGLGEARAHVDRLEAQG